MKSSLKTVGAKRDSTSLSEAISQTKLEYRAIDFAHHHYLLEKRFYHHLFKDRINQGDIQGIKSGEYGTLAFDFMRHSKNLFIVEAGILERGAIENNVDSHQAFTVGDLYIRNVEEIKTVAELKELSSKMRHEFQQMISLALNGKYSKPVAEAIKFINKNLSLDFSLDDIAKEVSKSRYYLSRQFNKEVGKSITDFIQHEKVGEAKILLELSSYSLEEIAGILNYSSKNYFIQCFKKITGITPAKYRNR